MSSYNLSPAGFQTMGSNGFSGLSLGNTTVSQIPTGGGGFLSALGGLKSPISTIGNAVKSFDKDPLGAVGSLASMIPGVGPIVGVVTGLIDFVGGLFGGVDFKKDVEPVIVKRVTAKINHAKTYYLGNSSLSPEKALTMADACVAGSLQWSKGRLKEVKSSAWKKGYRMQNKILAEFLAKLRQNVTSQFNVNMVTDDLRGFNLIGYKNKPFTFKYGSVYAHGIYTKKANAKVELVNGVPVNPTNPTKSNALPLIGLGVAFLFKKQIGKMLGIKL